jgi:hypothetical protein
MAKSIGFQDGVEAYRRAMLDLAPERKVGIDKLFGQSEARARAKAEAAGRTVLLPQDDTKLSDEQKALYRYPAADGTFPQLVDGHNEYAGVDARMAQAVTELRAEFRLRPFAG